MTKIVIFNGPPGSGKDTLAKLCVSSFRKSGLTPRHMEFKQILFDHTIKLFKIDRGVFFDLYNDRVLKEKKTSLLDGKSPREAMIYTSEDICKPMFGNDYFGVKLSESIDKNSLVFISDGGFTEEVTPLTQRFGIDNVYIIKLFRKGCSFKGDSRKRLDIDGVKTVTFHNDGPKSELLEEMKKLLNEKLNLGVEIVH